MKKILFLMLVSSLFLACSSDNDNDYIKEDASEYYIKYQVKSSSMYIGTINVRYNAENNQNKSIQTSRSGTWEIVIGPVKKGFKSSLSASDPETDLYHLKLDLKISVSKDGSQFADKAVNSSVNDRSSADTNYTIDY